MAEKNLQGNVVNLVPKNMSERELAAISENFRLRQILDAAVCCICERKHGEDGAELRLIHSPECVTAICAWPCAYLSKTHCFMKCRVCGAVVTIPKWQVPGGFSLGENAWIMFVEDCKLHGEGDRWRAYVKNAIPL